MATETNNPFNGSWTVAQPFDDTSCPHLLLNGCTPTSSDFEPTVLTDRFDCPTNDEPCSGPAGTYIAEASNG